MLRKVDQTLPPSEPLSDDEKHKVDTAISAVTSLATTVLGSDRRTRFSEAARICEIGQSLVKTTSRRVADQDSSMKLCSNDDMDAAEDNYGQILYNANGRLVDQYRRPLDENQIIRDALLSMSKASTEQQKLAAIAESEASELRSLAEVMMVATSPEKEVIEARIARLMKNMEDRNAVVPADDARRHPTGSQRGVDDPQGHGADPAGDGGHGEAPDEGAQARVG